MAMSAATSTRKRLRSMTGSEWRLAATDAANTVAVISSALTVKTWVRRAGRFMGNPVEYRRVVAGLAAAGGRSGRRFRAVRARRLPLGRGSLPLRQAALYFLK
jgi:hypothetical protein